MTQMHTWMLWRILWLLKYIPGGGYISGDEKIALLGTKYIFSFQMDRWNMAKRVFNHQRVRCSFKGKAVHMPRQSLLGWGHINQPTPFF